MRKTYLAWMAVVVAALLVTGNAWAFSFVSLGSIGDRVWYDADGMGDQDDPAVEPGINGVTVVLRNGITGAVISTQVTSTRTIDGLVTDGGYLFNPLAAGTYIVEVVASTIPAEYTIQTFDLNGPLDNTATGVTLTAGQQRRDVDFGYNKVTIPDGDPITCTQGGWGGKPAGNNPAQLLVDNFDFVCPGGVTIGSGANTATFTSAKAISDFLPAGGTAGVLSGALINPTKTSAGVLAGQVLAMTLNVKFADAGKLGDTLGDKRITKGAYDGYTVNDLLVLANQVLGGNLSGLEGSISDLNDACTGVNENFCDGANKGFLE